MKLRILAIMTAISCLATPIAGSAFAETATEAEALHVLNRLAFGPRPGDVKRVMEMGVDAYIDEQLHPETIPMPAELTDRLAKLSQGEMPQADLITTYRKVIKAAMEDGTGGAPGGGLAMRNALYKKMAVHFGELRLIPAIESPRQLEEVMVDFWFNHFNVVAGKGLDHVLIADYEREAISPYVMGQFRDLLGATARHPAMLFYLDNWLSVSPTADSRARIPGTRKPAAGLNENYARELMELHTLGVDGGYTQADVTTLARMLTGWSFDPRRAADGDAFHFFQGLHDDGDKVWLGKAVPVKGIAEGEWALNVLASSPATAHHISYELAQYFVADDPPPALVDRLAQRFLTADGDIRAVLETLFKSPEFRDPANFGAKFKTPYQYVISVVRAAGVQVNNVRPLLAAMYRMGMRLYGCQSPDGYKNTRKVWLNPDALARRISFATGIGLGRSPLAAVIDDTVGNDPYAGGAPRDHVALRATPRDTVSADGPPLDMSALLATVGDQISAETRSRIASLGPSPLDAGLVLGSPDFMRR
ncbi:MAG TPA: DUF1800 domain-containing protein [Roseiarcus sp.]